MRLRARGLLLDSYFFHLKKARCGGNALHSPGVQLLIKPIAVILAALATVTALPASVPKVTLSGNAQSCYPGTPIRLVGIRSINVSAFQVSKVPTIMSNLKTMDTVTITDGASMIRLDTLSRQTYRLVNSSTALARAVSDSTGSFKLNIPVTDSVVVYGEGDDPDTPFEQAFKTMSGRANGSFVLDMSHGGCSP
jgi:hypothetical protein